MSLGGGVLGSGLGGWWGGGFPVENEGEGGQGWGTVGGLAKEPASQCASVCQNSPFSKLPYSFLLEIRQEKGAQTQIFGSGPKMWPGSDPTHPDTPKSSKTQKKVSQKWLLGSRPKVTQKVTHKLKSDSKVTLSTVCSHFWVILAVSFRRSGAFSVALIFLPSFGVCRVGGLPCEGARGSRKIGCVPRTKNACVCVCVRAGKLRNIYHHHPESKKNKNLQRQTLAPSTPTVDMEIV